jgi:hypothetical protein
MKKVNLVLALLLCLLVSSCTFVKITGGGVKNLLLNNPNQKYELIGQLNEEKTYIFDYTNSFDVSEIVSEYLAKHPQADAVINLRISLKSTAGTIFANIFTLGIARARVMEIRGDLVKFQNGLSANSPNFEKELNLSELENNGEIKIKDAIFRDK